MWLKNSIVMLQSMLDIVIQPASKDIEDSLQDVREFKNLVKKIKQYPGTGKFAEKVSYALSGIRSVASAAKVVDDALKKLGIKYAEYAKISSPKELKQILSEKTEKALHNVSEEELEGYEKAKKVLFSHQYMHDEILDELKGKSGKYEGAAESVDGGAAKLDKRVKRRRDLKKALLKAFATRLNTIFDNILLSAKAIGEAVGAGKIPLSDALEKFPKALDLIPTDIQQRGVYYSLAGFFNDVRSREERERFISSARYLISVIDNITKEKGAGGDSHFKDMKRGFEEMIKLIEEYSSKFVEGFGPLPIYKASEGGAKTGRGDDDNIEIDNVKTMKGGDDDDLDFDAKALKEGGDIAIPEITRVAYQFSRLRDIINYYFRTARIRVNLAKASVEMKAYGEDYVKILGDAIAASVDQVQRDKNSWAKKVDDTNDPLYQSIVTNANDPSQKETLKNMVDARLKLYDTKIEMYRIAEAVDLYMKAFADGIAGNPDDVRNILKILNSTEVISKWFSEKSGDLLCQVFDAFPSSYVGNAAKFSHLNAALTNDKLSNVHYYVRVSAVCRLGTFATLAAEYPPVFPAGAGTWAAWETAVIPDASKRADRITPAPGGAAPDFVGPPSMPGNPFLAIPAYDANSGTMSGNKVLALMGKALSVSMLKNIVSAFATIGGHFGGQDLMKKTPMSTINLYRGLMNYMTQASFTMGMKRPGLPPNPPAGGAAAGAGAVDAADIDIEPCNAPPGISAAGQTLHGNKLRIGLTAAANLGAAAGPDYVKRVGAWAMRSRAPELCGLIDRRGAAAPAAGPEDSANFKGSPYEDDFQETDLLFVLVIKSIVAKILTTIGVYNMFNRPIQKSGLGYFSGLRLILGGAAGLPKIIPEALELYIRLPLLAEFYRKVFDFEAGMAGQPGVAGYGRTGAFNAIAMVPELDGTFAGLINIIFDRARYVENGAYSEADLRSIVEEINKIWLRFKDRKNTVTEVIHEFISEINRRIGIYNQQERINYLKERDELHRDRYDTIDRDEITDFELSTIDEEDTGFRPTPSMSYQTEGGVMGRASKDHKYKLDPSTHMGYIRNLRNTLDGMFQKAQGNIDQNLSEIKTRFTFEHIIKSRQEELKYAKTDKERFDIVQSAISSLGQFAMTSLEKSLILFHEKVVAPLASLHALYNMLYAFHTELQGVYMAVKKFDRWSRTFNATNVRRLFVAAAPGAADTQNGLFHAAHPFSQWVLPYAHGGAAAADVIVKRGTQGLEVAAARDATYNDLETILGVAGNQQEVKLSDLLFRLVPDQSQVMRKTLELLFGHAATLDKLVDFRLEVVRDNRENNCAITVNLDHSKLRQHISDVLSDVKQSLDKFRGLLPKVILDKYEVYKVDNQGSLYWLEKYLIDELLEGKTDTIPTDPDEYKNDNLDRAPVKLKYIFDYLTKAWDVNARGLVGWGGGARPANWPALQLLDNAGVPAAPPAGVTKVQHEFDRDMYDMVFYDPWNQLNAAFPAGGTNLAGPYNAATHRGLDKLLFNLSGKAKDGTPDQARWDPSLNQRRNNLYDPVRGIMYDGRRSVWILFNRFLAAYLSQVYDDSTRKVYATSIANFANGAFSSAVLGDAWYDDSQVWSTNNILVSGSRTKGVLLHSLARDLRQLMNEKTINGDKKQFLESDLAEIPLYVKERLKAELPVYNKIFSYLIKRCDMLKTMIRALNVEQRVDNANLPAADHAPGGPGVDAFLTQRTRSDNERNLTAVLDQIVTGSTSLMQCARDTYSELADDPKFMQLHQNFISEYEGTNGVAPFMPPSSMLYYLQNTSLAVPAPSDDRNDIAFPIYSLGDPRFKLMYGTRGVLNHDEVKPEDMPGYGQIIKAHNQSTDGKFHFDEKAGASTLNEYVALVRYLVDAKRYRGLFSFFNTTHQGIPINGLANEEAYTHTLQDLLDGTLTSRDQAAAPFALRSNVRLADVIRMTESSSQREQRRKIVALVQTNDECPPGADREDMLIWNLIDMNVVPVNVHALRREIPLVHLYNYSWTFDKLMADLFELGDLGEIDLGGNLDDDRITSGKKLLGYLLLNPFYGLSDEAYEFQVSKIIRGDLGIEGLGRPKYLADEVYNKPLFGELYPGELYHEDGGPAVGHGHLRGKREVLYDAARGGAKYETLASTALKILLKNFCANGAAGGYGVLPAAAARETAVLNAVSSVAIAGVLDGKGRARPLDLAGYSTLRRDCQTAAVNSWGGAPAAADHPDRVASLAVVLAAMLALDEVRNAFQDEARTMMSSHPGREWTVAQLTVLVPGIPLRTLDGEIRAAFAPGAAGAQVLGAGGAGGAISAAVGPLLGDLVGAGGVAPPPALGGALLALGAPAAWNAAMATGYIDSGMVGAKYSPQTADKYTKSERLHLEGPESRYFENALHYLESDEKTGEGKIRHVDVGAFKPALQCWGKLRFDTFLVRTLFWLTNIQRALRLKLRRDLTWFDQKVVTDHAVTASGITELFGNDIQRKNFPDDYRY
jgi:hypothetical protein